MNRKNGRILVLIVVLVLLAVPTLTVLAKELGMLTISGPGIKGELTLNDPNAMMKLERSGFFGKVDYMKPPVENLGQGYNITAHLNLDGKLVPFLQMVYYPAEEGIPGYVHYIGRLDGESLRKVDEWGTLNPEADTAFRGLMAANKITMQPAIVAASAKVIPEAPKAEVPAAPVVEQKPETVPAGTPSQPPYVLAAVITGIVILAGAGMMLRRRTAAGQQA